jgi:hypothetical protein
MPAIIEMRTYRVKPGQRAAFLEIFLAKSVPAHRALGMGVVGPFLSQEDPDAFFWMRTFPDLAARDAMKSAFYDGPLWKDGLEQNLFPLLAGYDVLVVEDAPGIVPLLGLQGETK